MNILKVMQLISEWQDVIADNEITPEEGMDLLDGANKALDLGLDDTAIQLPEGMQERLELAIADDKISLKELLGLFLQLLAKSWVKEE